MVGFYPDQVMLKPACSGTETGHNSLILYVEGLAIIFLKSEQ